ncbi:MAG: hypothetical protein AB8G96_00115 [Phycisphaerales bacterium]
MNTITLLATVGAASVAGALTAQEIPSSDLNGPCPSVIEYDHVYQYRVGQRAIFHMSGAAVTCGDTQGSAILDAVEMPDGTLFEHFYYPQRVFNLCYSGNASSMSVRGGTNTQAPVQGQVRIGQAGDSNGSDVSAADLEAFSELMLGAFRYPDVAHYVDLNWNCGTDWSFIIDFGVEVLDDDADRDDRGEILYFERGSCSGNSHLVFQAVDENGCPLGTPLVIGPEETLPTTPATVVSQEFGCAAIDLSRLGVDRARYIKVMAATPGVGGFQHGEQNPDFKVMAVYTTEPDPDRVRRVMPDAVFD